MVIVVVVAAVNFFLILTTSDGYPLHPNFRFSFCIGKGDVKSCSKVISHNVTRLLRFGGRYTKRMEMGCLSL